MGDLDGVLVGDQQPAGDEGVEDPGGGGVDGEIGAEDTLADRVAGVAFWPQLDHAQQDAAGDGLALASSAANACSAVVAIAERTPPEAR